MVLRLADVLAVPIADRNALLLAAGYAALYQETTSHVPPGDFNAPKTHKKQSGYYFLKSIQRAPHPFHPSRHLWNWGHVTSRRDVWCLAVRRRTRTTRPWVPFIAAMPATLLDASMGSAVHSLLEAGQCHTTLELSVKYVRPLTKNAGPVTAEGRVIHLSRRLATAEG